MQMSPESQQVWFASGPVVSLHWRATVQHDSVVPSPLLSTQDSPVPVQHTVLRDGSVHARDPVQQAALFAVSPADPVPLCELVVHTSEAFVQQSPLHCWWV